MTSLHLFHEVPDELRNLIGSGVEREMSGFEDMDFGFGHIAQVGLWFREFKR